MKPPQKTLPIWVHLLRSLVFLLLAIITLAVLGISILSYKGRRDWAATKADLIARGEKLSLTELAPPPIADTENFFADPIWAELFDLVKVINKDAPPTWEPRLPQGERQLDALNLPAPAEATEAAVALLPDLPKSPQERLKHGGIAHLAAWHLEGASDPATKQALARLIISAMAPSEPLRQRIRLLLNRPGAVFPFDPSKGFAGISILQINYLLSLAQANNQLARAYLVLDTPKLAGDEIVDNLRLADSLQHAPFLIGALMHITITGIAITMIDHGIAEHAWDAPSLERFEPLLARITLPVDTVGAIRGERGQFNQAVEAMEKKNSSSEWPNLEDPRAPAWKRAFLQSGYRFLLQIDQANYNRYLQSIIDSLSNEKGIDPSTLQKSPPPGTVYRLTHFTSAMAQQAFRSAVIQAAFMESSIRQTRIACALELYRLKHGTYPDKLDQLIPNFLPAIPRDFLAGESFQYVRKSPGEFRLWSVGWNKINDGGKPIVRKSPEGDGDWVWNHVPGSAH
jgi:hypothetical protein